MTVVKTSTQHGFLTPGHNCWNVWTGEGTHTLTNPGMSHRALESLAFAVDTLASDGWEVKHISLDQQGSPNFVFVTRQVDRSE
jgi:hypothetical protein